MALSNDGIFFQETHQNEEHQPNPNLVVNSLDENQYLQQFLDSSHSIKLQQRKQINKQGQKPPENQIVTGRFSQSQQVQPTSTQKGKRLKSFFHNFQKHLVITLRNIIKLKKCDKKGDLNNIANEMWNVFANSSLYSKKYLHVLYGVDSEEAQFSKEFLIGLGYMEFFSKYRQSTIKQVQQFLRNETIKQLTEISLKNYLSYRKMKRAAQFQKYLYEFIQELKEGCIKKRLPKERKQIFMNSSMLEQQKEKNTE